MLGLANLLPYLALASLALEATPVAAKTHGVARHPRAQHGARVLPVEQRGAQSKPRYQVLRRADGSKCRVRPKPAPPASESATADSNTGSDSNTSSNNAAPPSNDNTNVYQQIPQDENVQDTATDGGENNDNQGGDDNSNQGSDNNNQGSDNSNQGGDNTNQGSDNTSPPAPSSAPAPDASPAPAPPAPAWGGGKKAGLAWPDQYINAQPFLGDKIGWYYTWRASTVESMNGLHFAPMLWGPDRNRFRIGDDNVWLPSEFTDKMNNDWGNSGSVESVLFFNEPEIGDQANIGPDNPWGASVWRDYYLPARTKYGKRLGSASCTSGQPNADWVNTFKNTCKGAGLSDYDCSPDFYPLHYYDVLLDSGEWDGHHLTGFKDYIANYHQKADASKPVWVTEYGCHSFNGYRSCTWDEAKAFQEGAANWMDSQDYIERYATFGTVKDMQSVAEGNRMMDADGNPTDLGKWYTGKY